MATQDDALREAEVAARLSEHDLERFAVLRVRAGLAPVPKLQAEMPECDLLYRLARETGGRLSF